jgi:hypothetical protein
MPVIIYLMLTENHVTKVFSRFWNHVGYTFRLAIHQTSFTETVCGLGNQKNIAFNEVLENEGVEVYPSTVALDE